MIQHVEAERLLTIISKAVTSGKVLTYTSAAKELGRDPEKNARMVAQVCDLLDAAAALAGIPLLALIAVREKDGSLNRKAWANSPHREAVLNRSKNHSFTVDDYEAIVRALAELQGMGNKRAWRHVRALVPAEILYLRIAGLGEPTFHDAVDDLGSDAPSKIVGLSTSYARDPRIRNSVKLRAAGKCEHCGKLGFLCLNGERYLECHHIIALANDGADRMNNVIALCAEDHRRAHYAEDRTAIEQKMIQQVKRAEARRNHS